MSQHLISSGCRFFQPNALKPSAWKLLQKPTLIKGRALLPHSFWTTSSHHCCTSQAVVEHGWCWASIWTSVGKTAPPSASRAVNSKGSYRDSEPKPVCLVSRGEPGSPEEEVGIARRFLQLQGEVGSILPATSITLGRRALKIRSW